MNRLRRRKWVASAAITAMLTAQTLPSFAFNNVDARFRAHVGTASTDETPAAQSTSTPEVEPSPATPSTTTTPIKHVILIIGENRTFDHVFATYQPPKGQTVLNLLSEGIVNVNGKPALLFGRARQWQASDTTTYSNDPTKTSPYALLPKINTDGAPTNAPFATVGDAEAIEPALEPADYVDLTIGGTGLPKDSVDTRFPATLLNGPVPMDNYITYDDYASSPVHRFFQMWQQLDCSAKTRNLFNSSGCLNDLFPWVETSVGAGANGEPQPSPFTDQTTGEGGTSMQFFNVAKGDVPYFTSLARNYALSDNFHQSIMGGTGANHIMLGYGSLIYYADGLGNPATPPSGQIENPNPQTGTNNWYTEDGYGYAPAPFQDNGGSYVNCADSTQPGVQPIMTYLNSLSYLPFLGGDCAQNAYYLVNNYNPGYLGDGTPAPLGPGLFTIPPSTQPNLATLLSAHSVSWKYYGEGFAGGTETGEAGTFCNICDPFLYSTQIMTNPALRANNQDITDLYSDIQNNTLPAVSIVKPDGILDGHPASSKLELFEGFTKKIIDMIQANPSVWADTAVMITFDEGGGYWDSGYVQPIDFFGDGTRIPMIVVSPFSTGGRVVHTYYDHVSFDKFVEANWSLPPISQRGRDNLPNPKTGLRGPYVPINSPAIGDLMDMFKFPSKQGGHHHS
jgi:phospholipase C